MPGNSDDVRFAMGDGGECVLSDGRLVCGVCLAVVMDVCCVFSWGSEGVLRA